MNIKNLIPNFIKDIYSNIIYFIFAKKNDIKVLNDNETVEQIIKEKKSIARFGDGEFKWILGIKQNSFQDESQELSQRLKEVLECKDDNILICIPKAFNNVKGYTSSSKKIWKNFIRWHGKDIIKYLSKKYNYGNACFTRWYIEYKDKTDMKDKIKNIKRIWENKDIIIVEGKDTKIGVGNDLLDNSKSVKRIIAPSNNAFNRYNDILNEVKKVKKDCLILIALGPTATVLSYDLSKMGYQALDVGHIDIEYEWYLRKATKKVLIEGKYVNEAGGMEEKIEIDDKNYKESIIVNLGEDNK